MIQYLMRAFSFLESIRVDLATSCSNTIVQNSQTTSLWQPLALFPGFIACSLDTPYSTRMIPDKLVGGFNTALVHVLCFFKLGV